MAPGNARAVLAEGGHCCQPGSLDQLPSAREGSRPLRPCLLPRSPLQQRVGSRALPALWTGQDPGPVSSQPTDTQHIFANAHSRVPGHVSSGNWHRPTNGSPGAATPGQDFLHRALPSLWVRTPCNPAGPGRKARVWGRKSQRTTCRTQRVTHPGGLHPGSWRLSEPLLVHEQTQGWRVAPQKPQAGVGPTASRLRPLRDFLRKAGPRSPGSSRRKERCLPGPGQSCGHAGGPRSSPCRGGGHLECLRPPLCQVQGGGVAGTLVLLLQVKMMN